VKPWIVVLILAGCCIALLAQSATPQARPSSSTGRFQIVVNPSARADTFLLDTATGHVWQRTKYTNLPGQPEVWQIQDRVDSQVDLLAWASDHMPKPAPAPAVEAPPAPPAPPAENRPRQITDER
jgi:hypothetical protein